jgi:hypothetical protein
LYTESEYICQENYGLSALLSFAVGSRSRCKVGVASRDLPSRLARQYVASCTILTRNGHDDSPRVGCTRMRGEEKSLINSHWEQGVSSRHGLALGRGRNPAPPRVEPPEVGNSGEKMFGQPPAWLRVV